VSDALRPRPALLGVQPATVLRWHRRSFQAFWRWKSRATASGAGAGVGGQAGASAGSAAAAAPGPLCAPCETNAGCGQGTCLINDRTRARFCGQDCSSADCPAGYECSRINGSDGRQCVPISGICQDSLGAGGTGGASAPTAGAASGGTSSAVPGPTADSCDPGFLGPFCDSNSIIGFERGAEVSNPTRAQVQEFSVQALNYIRSLTCLPALELDSCLSQIGESALAANGALGVHGYFQQNCLNAAHGFGKSCECDWAQENFGAASGSSRTWKDGGRAKRRRAPQQHRERRVDARGRWHRLLEQRRLLVPRARSLGSRVGEESPEETLSQRAIWARGAKPPHG